MRCERGGQRHRLQPRGEDSGRATIDVLPEVVDAVQGKILVLVDGGFRRGTDIAKALAMGANAVGVGRPYLWGLGAFGEPGVAKLLEILRTETRVPMTQCGVRRPYACRASEAQKWEKLVKAS